jgi:hypothetical protein
MNKILSKIKKEDYSIVSENKQQAWKNKLSNEKTI